MEALSISTREARAEDIPALVGLYRDLEKEMTTLHPMWPLADGLAEPVESAFADLIDDPRAVVEVGELDDVPFGFIVARVEETLPQSNGMLIGSIRLVFVDQEAREVSLGEVMRDHVMDRLRERGITRFDAHVLPGHRLAKNFFEAGGFSARSIIMHHDDDAE